MNLKAGLEKFIGYFTPALYTSWVTYPSYKTDLKKIIFLSGIASLLEAAALGLIYFLVRIFTSKASEPIVNIETIDKALNSPLTIAIACCFLMTFAVTIKRATFKKTIAVSQRSGIHAGQLGSLHARQLVVEVYDEPLPRQEARSLMRFLTRQAPFSCGFAARSLASVAIHLMQAGILCLILLYLSPILTVIMLATALVLITFLSASYEAVVESNEDRTLEMSNYRQELKSLSDALADPSLGDEHFAKEVSAAFSSGSTHQQLEARMSERQQRLTGSLAMEYIYPIVIVAVSLMYTFSGDMAPDITRVALYILLTRQVVVSLYSVGTIFMSLSRHHQQLTSFWLLMVKDVLPLEVEEPEA